MYPINLEVIHDLNFKSKLNGFRHHVHEFLVGDIVSSPPSQPLSLSHVFLGEHWTQSKCVARWGKKGNDFADDPDWGMKCHNMGHTHCSTITPVQKRTGPSWVDPGLINSHTLLNLHTQRCLPTPLPSKDPSWRTQSAQQSTCCLLERTMSVHNQAMQKGEKSTGCPCTYTLPLQEVNWFTCF